LYTLIGLAVVGGVVAIYQYMKYRGRRQRAGSQQTPSQKAA